MNTEQPSNSPESDELRDLRRWKEEALQVMPDFQAIGKLLNVPLGGSVSEQIIPRIKALIERAEEAEHRIKKMEQDQEDMRMERNLLD